MDVVVDGLGHTDDGDLEAAALDLRRELHGTANGAVAADHEQDADAVRFEMVDDLTGILRSARRAEDGPALMMDVRDRCRRQCEGLVTEARDQSFVAVTKPENPLDAVPAHELEHDAADDVVDPGTQTAAGDDAAADGAGIEENLVARPGELEGRQRRRVRGMDAERRQPIVDHHLLGRAHERDGARRGAPPPARDEAAAKVFDGGVGAGDGTCERRRPGSVTEGTSVLMAARTLRVGACQREWCVRRLDARRHRR